MRVLAGLLLCLSLAACLTTGKRGNEQAMTIYDLGPSLVKMPADEMLTATTIEVHAPLWLDTMGIDYRLLYVDPANLREYALARWVGPPSQLIIQRLQQAGVMPVGQGRAACIAHLEISEFAQWFDTPAHSRAVLQGRIQWFDRSRTLLGEQLISIEKPAPTADAQGAVRAFSAVLGQLVTELAEGKAKLPVKAGLPACHL